jgi:hypothetical protein
MVNEKSRFLGKKINKLRGKMYMHGYVKIKLSAVILSIKQNELLYGSVDWVDNTHGILLGSKKR